MRAIRTKKRVFCCKWMRFIKAAIFIPIHFCLAAEINLDNISYNNFLGKNPREIASSFELDSGKINGDGWQTVGFFSYQDVNFEVSLEMQENKCVAISIAKGQLPISPQSRELFEKLAGELRERFGDAPLLDLNKFIQQEDATETPGYTWVNETQALGLQYSICPYGASILLGLDDKQYKLKESGLIPREMGNLETIFNKHSGKLPSDWNAARKLWDAKQDADLLEETSRDTQETASNTTKADSSSSVVSAKPEIVATSTGDPARFRQLTLTAIGILGLLIIAGFLLMQFRARKQ